MIKANSLVFTIGGLPIVTNEHEPLTAIEAYNDIIWQTKAHLIEGRKWSG